MSRSVVVNHYNAHKYTFCIDLGTIDVAGNNKTIIKLAKLTSSCYVFRHTGLVWEQYEL